MIKRQIVYYMGCFIFILIGAVVVLALKYEESRTKQIAQTLLQIGSTIGPFEAIDSQGQEQIISDDRYLAMFYSSSCSACEENIPHYMSLVAKTGNKAFLFSTDGKILNMDEKIIQNKTIPSSVINKFRITKVPITIYVHNGIIRFMHEGVVNSYAFELFKLVCESSETVSTKHLEDAR